MDILIFILAVAFVILGIWTVSVMVGHYSKVDRPVRFNSMLDRLGLSLQRARITEYADHLPTAARLCMSCKDGKACDAWLASRERRADPPDFCPNANFIRQLLKRAEAA